MKLKTFIIGIALLLGCNVHAQMFFGEEKAIVDLMLGILSMVSSTRTLETYKIDMLDRGQTQARIEGVSKSLKGLSTALVPVKVSGTIAKTTSDKKSTQKGKRL